MSLSKNLFSDLSDHHNAHARSTDWYVTTILELDKQIAKMHGPVSSMQGAPNWS